MEPEERFEGGHAALPELVQLVGGAARSVFHPSFPF
jgi:hypothetical protein